MLAALLPALLPVVQQIIDRVPDPEAKAQTEATASPPRLASGRTALLRKSKVSR